MDSQTTMPPSGDIIHKHTAGLPHFMLKILKRRLIVRVWKSF